MTLYEYKDRVVSLNNAIRLLYRLNKPMKKVLD